jgi:hypothetical protein
MPRLSRDPATRFEQARTAGRETVAGIAGGAAGLVLYNLSLSGTVRTAGGFATDLAAQMISAIVVGMGAWYAALGPIRRASFAKIAPFYLSECRCPSCGYGITDLPACQDGCVVCPECNAAWKADRLGTS